MSDDIQNAHNLAIELARLRNEVSDLSQTISYLKTELIRSLEITRQVHTDHLVLESSIDILLEEVDLVCRELRNCTREHVSQRSAQVTRPQYNNLIQSRFDQRSNRSDSRSLISLRRLSFSLYSNVILIVG